MSKPSAKPVQKRTLKDILLMIVSVVGGILLWQVVVTAMDIPSYVLPKPMAVLNALIDGLFHYPITHRASFIYHLFYTFQGMLVGFGIGVGLGLFLAALMSEFPSFETTALPYLVGLQSTPKIAIAPLMVIWLGYGMPSKAALAALLTLFPMLVNSLAGFRSTERARLELLASLNASRWQVFWSVKFPSALPYIFTGVNLAVVYSLLGAIVAEFVGAQKGMGVIITQLKTVADTAGIFAALVVLAATGYVLHQTIRGIQHRVIFWAESNNEQTTP